ncbi:MAG: TolC family protein [Thermoguttaceae bacterium]
MAAPFHGTILPVNRCCSGAEWSRKLLPRLALIVALLASVIGGGCQADKHRLKLYPLADCDATSIKIEYPDLDACAEVAPPESGPPLTIEELGSASYWDLRLEEVLQTALTNNKVLGDLGGKVIRAPDAVPTLYGPAIQETDPRYGVEAALSAFDAQFSTSAFFEKNDRALNNQFYGGGTRLLVQDDAVFQTQLTKRTATGTELTLRKYVEYDANNAPGNAFPSVWNVNPEFEMRVPLLQGAGAEFNRIAGPTTTPGLLGGVLLARINTDISVAELQIALCDYVSNVENAYWDLYFAYRDLDSKIAARDTALETWRRTRALYEAGREGGEAENEAQAREQYFRFEEEVQEALTGRLVDGTQTDNGSRAGTFRGTGGVQVAERRLRLLMGVPISDGQLIRPVDEPAVVPIRFDWSQAVADALDSRVELRQQRWRIKMRQLELKANRNFLLPQLDAVGRYRWRGMGQDLINPNGNQPPFDNAYQTLMDGDFQEWQLGVELTVPIGHRRAHMAVRNAELNLAREQAILKEQQRVVLHDLSNGVGDLQRAEAVVRTTYNRRVAAAQQLAAVQAAYDAGDVPLDRVLEAQRRRAEAESRHHRARVEFALAVKNIHFDKGTLLEYYRIYMAEGGWPQAAYHDAAQRRALQVRPCLDYRLREPLTVASPDPQPVISPGDLVQPLPPPAQTATAASLPAPANPPGRRPGLVPLPDVSSAVAPPASFQAPPVSAAYFR